MKGILKKGLLFLMTGCMICLTGCNLQTVKSGGQTAVLSEYVTADGCLTLQLPGEDWKLDEESEDCYIFSYPKGLVMFTHSENAAGERYPESAGDLDMILDIEGYYSEGYDVLEFKQLEVGSMKSFQAVIHYTEKKAMYECGILHGVLIGKDAYMASAMLASADDAFINAMKIAVFEYQWELEEDLENPVVIQEATPEVTPQPTEAASVEIKPEAIVEVTPEPTPESTPEPTPEPTPEVTPEPKRVVTPVPESEIKKVSKEGVCNSSAYVRNAPDNESDVIGSVEEGQNVKITGEIRNWYRIKFQGDTAYVCKDYIK